MWSAVEALEEHAELTRKVAGRMFLTGRERAAADLRARAVAAEARAGTLRAVLGSSEPQPESDAA